MHSAVSIRPLERGIPNGYRFDTETFRASRNLMGWGCWAYSPLDEQAQLVVNGRSVSGLVPLSTFAQDRRWKLFREREEDKEQDETPYVKTERVREAKELFRSFAEQHESSFGMNPLKDTLIFSPDGARTACAYPTDPGDHRLMLDGEQLRVSGTCESFGFSPNSKRFFAIIRGQQPSLYLDGAVYDGQCSDVEFSPNSEHWFACLFTGSERFWDEEEPEDEKPEPWSDRSENHVLLDGKFLMRVIGLTTIRRVLTNTSTRSIARHTIEWSPDSKFGVFGAVEVSTEVEPVIAIVNESGVRLRIPGYRLLNAYFEGERILKLIAFESEQYEHFESLALLTVDLSHI
ncbi:MAG: hypothetical protein U0136_21985 [Bdellovibrionota bacterium]